MKCLLLLLTTLAISTPALASDGTCPAEHGGLLASIFGSVGDARDFVRGKIDAAKDRAEYGLAKLKEQTPDDLLPWRGAKDPGTPATLPPCEGKTGGLKIMSYNIRSTRESSLNQIARDINAESPDFVGLQEVDRDAWRTGHKDQPKELAKRTRLEHFAFGNAGRRNWLVSNYGIAILSKYEMVDTRTYALPSGKEPRVMMCTKVLAPAGTTTICNAHLGLASDERLAQVKEMNRIIAGFGTDRVVLMGDFNETPDKSAVEWISSHGWRDTWDLAGEGSKNTFPAKAPAKKIDYIFLGAGISGAGCEHVPEVHGSDHRPLVTTVE